jgi:hypothetical protein
MTPSPRNLHQIKIQTARMLEIYALLHKELDEATGLSLSAAQRAQLNIAVDKIEANMRELQVQFARRQEESSEARAELEELDEILNAVLQWHMEEEH